MGRFCYPSADMATYLYPKALEEARGDGAPIDQMNEGEKDRAIILPNGMLIESVAEAYYARQAARARILAEGRGHVWRFVFIARVVPLGSDRPDSLLAVLRDQGLVNFHLDVLGPKDHLPEYYELCLRTIEELNMGEYITFHGTVNVRAMLDRFDLLLMPSYNEGQPIVALEAMAASIPLVSTDVGGMSQLTDDVLVAPDGHEIGNCGILTIPGDIHGFAAALCTLMEEPSIYERYCVNAYDRIVSFFQLRLVMDRYNTIYRELGKLPPRAPEFDPGTMANKLTRWADPASLVPGSATARAHYPAAARFCGQELLCVAILQPWELDAARYLKSVHLKVVVLAYKCLSSTRSYEPGPIYSSVCLPRWRSRWRTPVGFLRPPPQR